MLRRAGPGRGVGKLARLLACELDQLGERVGREARMGDDHQRHQEDVGDRLEVDQRPVRQVGIEAGIDAEGAAGRRSEACSRRAPRSCRTRRRDAAAAGLVLDHDLLLPYLGQLLGHQAGEDVGRLAGRERHDEAHRLGRPRRLRPRGPCVRATSGAQPSARTARRVATVIVSSPYFPIDRLHYGHDDARRNPHRDHRAAERRRPRGRSRSCSANTPNSLGFSLAYQDFEKELADFPGKNAAPEGALLLAMADGQAAGTVALRKIDAGTCEMKRLYVKPAFRGRRTIDGCSIGRALAEDIVAIGRERGYQRLRLDTITGKIASACRSIARWASSKSRPTTRARFPTPPTWSWSCDQSLFRGFQHRRALRQRRHDHDRSRHHRVRPAVGSAAVPYRHRVREKVAVRRADRVGSPHDVRDLEAVARAGRARNPAAWARRASARPSSRGRCAPATRCAW